MLCSFPTHNLPQVVTLLHAAVDCGELGNPNNGHVNVSSTLFTSQANYGCDEGYNLTGEGIRTCESDGEWLPANEPTCEGIQRFAKCIDMELAYRSFYTLLFLVISV